MKQVDAADYVVGVVGAGAMGQGIVQVAVQGAMRALILDARPGAAGAARETIAGRLERLVEKGRIGAADAAAAVSRMEVVEDFAALAPCDAVIEAIFEDLEVKRETFARIEAAVAPECLIVSNTSSIPIASIARACRHRDRIAGMHFFNPVPLMGLVEVIRAAETSDATIEALSALGRRMGRTPVTVKDSPGFLVNMGGRAYTTEGLRIAHEQVATPAQIDAIMRDCWHFRMGPFELMDLTGIDVNFPVSRIIYDGYMQDPRIKTSPNHLAMFDAGLYGRKTGKGWYEYENGQALERPSPDFVTDAPPLRKVVIAGLSEVESDQITILEEDDRDWDIKVADFIATDGGRYFRVDDQMRRRIYAFCQDLGLEVLEKDDGQTPVLVAPVGSDATTVSQYESEFRRFVMVDLTGDISQRVVLMTAPGADPAALESVAAAIVASGRKVTAIKDSPGFVGQRICAMLANLGCYMAEIGLASPADIDTAMELGLNYPLGPLALAEKLGADATLQILEQLQEITGEDRYRPTMWLKRRARLGLPIDTEG